jgi:integrase/recombinase XerD
MLEQIYSRSATVAEFRGGPLGPFVDDFASILASEGYSYEVIESKLAVIRSLHFWLVERGILLADLTSHRIDEFVIFRKRQYGGFRHKGHGSTLRAFVALLRSRGLIPPEELAVSRLSALDERLKDFGEHLERERGVTTKCREAYCDLVRQFLTRVGGITANDIDELSPDGISAFIVDFRRSCSLRHAQTMVTAIRSYLRFLKFRGKAQIDMTGGVLAFANWRGAQLPETLTKAQLKALFRTCNRRTALGRRDYALLLLLARTGLRACEVHKLKLRDVNWERGELVVHGKGRRQATIPLIQDVGNALAAYLKNGRPTCQSPQLFVRAVAPYNAFKRPGTISTIVRVAVLKAGLKTRCKGAHLLRRTIATHALQAGATLAEVGELLRHRSIESTKLYAKVDHNRLRELVVPWPGTKEKSGGAR